MGNAILKNWAMTVYGRYRFVRTIGDMLFLVEETKDGIITVIREVSPVDEARKTTTSTGPK